MGIVYALSILLMGLTLVIGVISLIVLVIMAVLKKKLKAPIIMISSAFGLFIISSVTAIVISQNNEGDTIALIEEPPEDMTTENNEIDEESETHLDLSEYEELDPQMLNDGEYEKQTSLKFSGAEVLAIVPDDEIGNQIIAVNKNVDDEVEEGIIIHDVVERSEIVEDEKFTFYGAPDPDGRLILVEVEEE